MEQFDSEKCTVGVQHTEQIKTLYTNVGKMETMFARILTRVETIGDTYAKRPTWIVCGIITGLSSFCAALVIWIITHPTPHS